MSLPIWNRIANRIRSSLTSKSQTAHAPRRLFPLTPEYIENEHKYYVDAINDALSDKNIRNIALSGNYGVGKSSILQEVARLHDRRVVELSLSTLAPINNQHLDESIPKQATTPTNRIQQEIVKQLLYLEDPVKAPDSRFRRIERFSIIRTASIAMLGGILTSTAFFLAGWTEKIRHEISSEYFAGNSIHLLTFLVSAILIYAIKKLYHGRIHINKVSAGAATVSLDEKSVSYFDQYLDEIVYFFDSSKYDIAIFEDIDRFNDSKIFETLRSLNSLLNSAPQIGRPIRFIYAIKDSIFDQSELSQRNSHTDPILKSIDDPALQETIRANRTKFFDLIIPVVPFITNRTAKNIAAKLIGEISSSIDLRLADLAFKYIPEMRLLKNVRNEFIVFREHIYSGDGENLQLSDTHLFAMMLYKSTHLGDFELIRLGKSNLDKVYTAGREIAAESIRRAEARIRSNRNQISTLKDSEKNAISIAASFKEHIKVIARAIGAQERIHAFQFNGRKIAEEDLSSSSFWITFTSSQGDPSILASIQHPRFTKFDLEIYKSDLIRYLGKQPLPETWEKEAIKDIEDAIKDDMDDLQYLRSADMSDLISSLGFTTKYNNKEANLDEICRDILKEGLAYQLVKNGFIDKNYSLYTSTFHGERVSTSATNFIIHNIERNVIDAHFKLTEEDVGSIIREYSNSTLREKCFYNISILDSLLVNDEGRAKEIVSSLSSLCEEQDNFIQTYLNNGSQIKRFTRLFTSISKKSIVYIALKLDIEDETRTELVSEALRSMNENLKYDHNKSLSEYLISNYASLSALKDDSTRAEEASNIARFFYQCGIAIPELQLLSVTVRNSFIDSSIYEINKENIATALSGLPSLSLNNARSKSFNVYRYLVEHPRDYYLAVRDSSPTIDSRNDFIDIIEDIMTSDDDTSLGDIISCSTNDCTAEQLDKVSERAWPYLARYSRFPLTYHNVAKYIDVAEGIDNHIEQMLLSSESIDVESDHVSQDEKMNLAISILCSSFDSLPPDVVAKIICSLDLSEYVPAEKIPKENGFLFTPLVLNQIIEDSRDTYLHLKESDWKSKESFIQVSMKFDSYVDKDLISGDVKDILCSERVKHSTKLKIKEIIEKDPEHFALDELRYLSNHLHPNRIGISVDLIRNFVNAGAPSHEIISFLSPHLQTLAVGDILWVLENMKPTYPDLLSKEKKKTYIPYTPDNYALLGVLKHHGVIVSFRKGKHGIAVTKR